MTFSQMFGAARWVGAPAGAEASACFRASFSLEECPEYAELTIVGLGFFEAALNGAAVTDELFLPLNSDFAPRTVMIRGEAWDEVTAHRLYCPFLNVTPLLRTGENVLEVMVGTGWFAETKLSPFGGLRLVFSLALHYADGAVRYVVSDGRVKTKAGYITESHLRTGETHDYAAFREDEGWQDAPELPPLETDYLYSNCPADRVIRRLTPTLVGEADGVRVYDCGENTTGWPVLIDRAEAGEEIEILVSERLTADGRLEEKHMHGQHLRVISDGRGRVLHPRFTWFGFRYFSVRGRAEPTSVWVIHADVAVTSEFHSDSAVLNWLYEAYLRAQLTNMHAGIPSDCPHIERCGYTGDGELCCDAAMTMLDGEAFYRKWIGDISDCQDRLTGHVQYTAPYVRCGGGPGGWGCAIVEVPYTFYRHYGDAEPFAAMYGQMLHYFDYLDAHSEERLVTSDRPGEWCLGDWLAPGKTVIPEPFVNTYFYMKSIDRVLEMLPVIGREADAAALMARRAALAEAMTAAYFDEATGDFCGGVQGANAFAVDVGLGDARTYANLAAHYQKTGMYDTGIFGTDIVTRILFTHGDGETAARLLMSEGEVSFGDMRARGATTLHEYWGDPSRSDNHPMFGAVTRYLFQYLLGIRQTKGSAGWREVEISPVFVPQLQHVSGAVTVRGGRIAVSLEQRGGMGIATITVPAGVRAHWKYGDREIPLAAGTQTLTCAI